MFHLIFDLQHRDSDTGARRSLLALPVSERFRGWNFLSEDFATPYPSPQVSVGKIFREAGPDREMHLDPGRVRGDLFHTLYSRMITLPVIELGRLGSRAAFTPSLKALLGRRDSVVQEILDGSTVLRKAKVASTVNETWISNVQRELAVVWDHEISLLTASGLYLAVTYPSHSVTNLVDLCIPLKSELPIDGSRLQLSSNTQVDAWLSHIRPMVVELKTGPTNVTHRLAVAGYALAIESVDRTPVDFGCVYYCDVTGGSSCPKLSCDVFAIGDALRSEFIRRRNDMIVQLNEHPG